MALVLVLLLVSSGLAIVLYEQSTRSSVSSKASTTTVTDTIGSTTTVPSTVTSTDTTGSTTTVPTTTTVTSTSTTTIKPAAVKLILDVTPGPSHAPYYYGYEQGIFAQNHIDLTIIPGTTVSTGLAALEAGDVNFAIADPSNLVLFAANSNFTNIKMVALTYERNFAAVVYNNATISKPSNLNGKAGAMANPATSSLSSVFTLFAKANDLNTSTMNLTFASGATPGDLLLEGKVQFIVTTIQNLPTYNAEGASLGLKFGAFDIASYGVDLTGFAIATTEAMIQQQPGVVQDFVNATMESFAAAIPDPQAAVSALVAYNPQLNATTSIEGFQEDLGCCTINPSGLASPLQYGWMNPQDMQQTVANVVSALNINATVIATNLYTDQFLEQP